VSAPPPGRPVSMRIRHRTTYRYGTPVTFGEHRVMFRPRDAHDIDTLDARLIVEPAAEVRWIHDVHSNSVAIVQPREASDRLVVDCLVDLVHRGLANLELPLEPRALELPIAYDAEERQVLAPWLAPVEDDPGAAVAAWAKGFVARTDDTRTAIDAMLAEFREQFVYRARDEEGTQRAAETLATRAGTCRDYAWLMIEALRSIGIAGRFVTGYLYDPGLDPGAGADGAERTGAGATHAWVQVYLPGAGWVPYDPTNRLTGGTDLVLVGYARRPQDAVPLSGSWFGSADAYVGMSVEVTVERR